MRDFDHNFLVFRLFEVENDVGVLAAVDSFHWAVLNGILSVPLIDLLVPLMRHINKDQNEVIISVAAAPARRYKIPEDVKITQLALIGDRGYCLSGRSIVSSFVLTAAFLSPPPF